MTWLVDESKSFLERSVFLVQKIVVVTVEKANATTASEGHPLP